MASEDISYLCIFGVGYGGFGGGGGGVRVGDGGWGVGQAERGQ